MPITLNVVSKILAFVTVLTLFLPQRPPRSHAVQRESLAEAQPAGRPVPDAPASIDIADDQPVTAGHPAGEAR